MRPGDAAGRVVPLLELHRYNRAWRDALFHPPLQRGFDIAFRRRLAWPELSEEVRTRSAATVLHARHHVQPHEAGWRSHLLVDAAVVVDEVVGGNFTSTGAFGSGIRGNSLGSAGTGVNGSAAGTGSGVAGSSDSGSGVFGSSVNGTGALGSSVNGAGVFASSGGAGLNTPALRANNTNPNGIGIWTTSNSVDATLVVSNAGTGDLIRAFSGISGEPIFAVQNNGTTSTRVLQITGGSDLAEHFEIVERALPGLVVAIDLQNAGKLAIARGAYNRRVAGIISGAGNLASGMVLPDASGARKSLPIALSGRVWVYCDATHHSIMPGDLLTTSRTPGHAMKVTNYAQAQGAIIGKAMTGLKYGRGLVLALVSLQ